ncbi:TonB-denpendent receptor [Asticcacaulis sp. AC460]|uniref:TonB-dependent receptor plug domain-containing protein n=1 Tax=Asticcacaulis sp. AC460 TaxID=1282360 RepID=UPI0003C4005B|nr:TonB-dependent receptor plug domain-containing protein [Asticcacaulis sp. AC460]ESQ86711.1 TonB-denpendent receptor [Asticcacaulis sp. AC460]
MLRFKRQIVCSVSALVLGVLATGAYAQDTTAAAPEATTADDGAVIITASRITTRGFKAPTPTSSLGANDIANNAQPNIFTTVAQLPSLQGSSGTTTNTFSTSSGQQGLSSFALRGLGVSRTLTLLDGQRVVPANIGTGAADISLFPQLLIKRVDVVNGGASASWGSDAVGGVINFVTDTRFEGFKANFSLGETTYGDDKTGVAQVAFGKAFLDDKLHTAFALEYHKEDGVGPGDFGEKAANGRDWYRSSTLVNTGQTNNGSPQFRYLDHAQSYTYGKYGLITAGPLQGIAFDQSGNPYQFVYGSNGLGGPAGVPQKDANGTVAGCYTGFCIGGDTSANVGVGATLQSGITRTNFYNRTSFDLNEDSEIYFTVNLAKVDTHNQPNPGTTQAGLTIQCANPYVPGAIKQACTDNNITSFRFGTVTPWLPNIRVNTQRKQERFVVGSNGRFNAFGTDWSYNAYYQAGKETSDINVHNLLLKARFTAAINATTINNVIVCADPVARANGCVPVNVIGNQTPSAAALAYLQPAVGAFQHTIQTQNVASVGFSGEPFSLWAGPVSMAFGAEYRRETYRAVADPYGNGISSPYTAEYPADPLLSTGGGNFYAGNYRNGRGSYTVAEAFLEFNVPLLNSEQLGQVNLNTAGRSTNYSTSGGVEAWKVGLTWDTPLDGIRIRTVRSQDVRAPNLNDLFGPIVSTNLPNFTNPFTNTTLTVSQNQGSNPGLVPEIAQNFSFGVVLANPDWLPGFNASVDYYSIEMEDAIAGGPNATQLVQYCFDGSVPSACNAFNLTGANPYVNVGNINAASIKTHGVDYEFSYQASKPFGLPGNLVLRGLATNVQDFTTTPGLPGTVPSQTAGQNSGATPDWKVLFVQTYSNDKFSFLIQERWFSDGVIGNQYVVCSSGCPASTGNRPTLDNNTMKGMTYIDIGGTYNVRPGVQAYFKVDNLLNADPEPSPQTNTGLDVNPALYDTLGRFYRVGVRFNY